MPQVSTIISGAASLGVLAGVVSGIFYLVLTGIRWAGRVRAALQEEELRKASERCVSCGRCFSAVDTKPVVCVVCARRACFDIPCSRPAPLGWTCVPCHVNRSDGSSGSWTDVKSDEEIKTSSKSEFSDIDGQTVQVRDFIEKLVEKIVNGPLDGVTVGKLSNHAAYNEMFNNYHEPVCKALAQLSSSLQASIECENTETDMASNSAHKALVQLIQKVVNEAMKLPNLSQSSPSEPSIVTKTNDSNTLQEKSYEDILSTAILNKIIEKYQQKNGYYEYQLDNNRNHLDLNNLEKVNNFHNDGDDSDWSDFSRPDPLALKIEEHIEEVTTAYESSSDDNIEELDEAPIQLNRRVPFPEYGVDIVDGTEVVGTSDEDSDSCATDVLSVQSTWEENWLFQKKKKIKSDRSCHPVPVPMLVPNPDQEYRPLIGGIHPDDISDLSDCSDSVLEEAMSEIADDKDRVLEIIDALNRESPIEEETNQASSLDNEPPSTYINEITLTVIEDGKPEFNTRLLSTSAENLIETVPFEEESTSTSENQNSVDSLEVDLPIEIPSSPTPSLGQQDREIAVDYAAISQINRPPIPRPRTLDLADTEAEPELDLEEKPIKCPIAEREKAKWENAIEMKDNPYTPENIAKRANSRRHLYHSGSSSSQSVDFPDELTNLEEIERRQRKYGRDYYIKASKSPTGERPNRSTDSPASIRSETSMEDNKNEETRSNVEIWTDMPSVALVLPVTPTPRKRNLEKRSDIESDSSQISLPKVSELKKNFLTSKPPIPSRSRSAPPTRKYREIEKHIDYTPVAQIVDKLSIISKNVPEQTDKQNEIYEEIAEIRRESLIKSKSGEIVRASPIIVSNSDENLDLLIKKTPIKPVHSLTARSIPKDFREGLKNNSQNMKSLKSERIGEIYSGNERNATPSLNFDVKNKKKFWENIGKSKN